MNAWSLVGMTQGARKRLCREDQRLEVAGEDVSAAALKLLHEIRLLYRIGQRLRPCPGCAECAYITFVGGRPVRNDKHICDGSGVLPAKKAKVKQWATI